MNNVKIVYLPFLFAPWEATGQVIFPEVIFLRRGTLPTPAVVAHELAHVYQIRRMGLLMYWFRYLFLLFRVGYANHPLELEALEWAESDVWQEIARGVISANDPRAK